MTEQEFTNEVRRWATVRKRTAASAVSSSKKGVSKKEYTPELEKNITYSVRTKKGYTSVSFKFPRHGVFYHHGVGRGYILNGGTVTRGHRAASNKASYERLKKQGYTDNQINKMKTTSSGAIRRHPVDWINSDIAANIGDLANMAANYYGDKALQQVLDSIDKMKI